MSRNDSLRAGSHRFKSCTAQSKSLVIWLNGGDLSVRSSHGQLRNVDGRARKPEEAHIGSALD
jgi:hypothetical protein